MPRRRCPISDSFPYHVTARAFNREKFEVPLDDAWVIFEDYLYLMAKGFDVGIHSFVMMPNHFHLVVTTPLANISEAMQYFLGQTSREFSRLSGRINQSYGNRHFKSQITSFHHYMNVYKYVYRNPVRARICRRVEDYPFSTLSGATGRRRLAIPLLEDTLLFSREVESTLKWLNTQPEFEDEDQVRLALRRGVFAYRPNKRNREKCRLEVQLL